MPDHEIEQKGGKHRGRKSHVPMLQLLVSIVYGLCVYASVVFVLLVPNSNFFFLFKDVFTHVVEHKIWKRGDGQRA